jgi:hypothetical protein
MLFPNLYIRSNYLTDTIFHWNKLHASLIFNFYIIFVVDHNILGEPKHAEPGIEIRLIWK